jgi:uncharacterized protein (DUF488 family)
MTIYTIGFTKKSLREFIEILRAADVRCVIDVRLRNTSQLAGWSKQPDFEYLLKEGFGIGYEHHPEFAPTGEMLDEYKRDGDWAQYEKRFNQLLAERQPSPLTQDKACLLCTEVTPEQCHRRLVADYLHQLDPTAEIKHL